MPFLRNYFFSLSAWSRSCLPGGKCLPLECQAAAAACWLQMFVTTDGKVSMSLVKLKQDSSREGKEMMARLTRQSTALSFPFQNNLQSFDSLGGMCRQLAERDGMVSHSPDKHIGTDCSRWASQLHSGSVMNERICCGVFQELKWPNDRPSLWWRRSRTFQTVRSSKLPSECSGWSHRDVLCCIPKGWRKSKVQKTKLIHPRWMQVGCLALEGLKGDLVFHLCKGKVIKPKSWPSLLNGHPTSSFSTAD